MPNLPALERPDGISSLLQKSAERFRTSVLMEVVKIKGPGALAAADEEMQSKRLLSAPGGIMANRSK